ncbi:MAG: helix-turn-helix transcriptional regulator [Acetivibrio sp.]
MNYKMVSLKQDFIVERIATVHYFEYMSDFQFEGESHPFWEFLCVDRGEVNVIADNRNLTLKKGEVIFHKPNEFHNLKANGIIAPNLVVVSFECHSPRMNFFESKILSISEIERNLLGSIILEARSSFSSPLDNPYMEELVRSSTQTFGSEQLIKLHLEEFLLQLYRRYLNASHPSPIIKSTKSHGDEDIYSHIIHYLETNVYQHLSTEQICKDNLIGLSQLQKLFRDKHNCGIIDYFTRMKIDSAKQMIRDKHMNFTQISDALGYSSIHYFSRIFKKITGMTPSDYASSIKLRSEESHHL